MYQNGFGRSTPFVTRQKTRSQLARKPEFFSSRLARRDFGIAGAPRYSNLTG